MSDEVTMKLAPSVAFRVFTMLEAMPTGDMGKARKVASVMDALEEAYDIEELTDRRAKLLAELQNLRVKEQRGDATEEDSKRLRTPLARVQRQFYKELDGEFEHKPVTIVRKHADGALDLIGKGELDDVGRRAVLAFSDALQDAQRHGE